MKVTFNQIKEKAPCSGGWGRGLSQFRFDRDSGEDMNTIIEVADIERVSDMQWVFSNLLSDSDAKRALLEIVTSYVRSFNLKSEDTVSIMFHVNQALKRRTTREKRKQYSIDTVYHDLKREILRIKFKEEFAHSVARCISYWDEEDIVLDDSIDELPNKLFRKGTPINNIIRNTKIK